MAVVAAVLSNGLNLLVKDLIQRPGPPASLVHVLATLTDPSFPSGHVMFYTGFFGLIVFLAFSLLKPSLKRSMLLAFFGLLVILVGFLAHYTGEHWASDVLGAYLLGSLVLVAIVQLYRWGKPRFFLHQPVAKAAQPVNRDRRRDKFWRLIRRLGEKIPNRWMRTSSIWRNIN